MFWLLTKEIFIKLVETSDLRGEECSTAFDGKYKKVEKASLFSRINSRTWQYLAKSE